MNNEIMCNEFSIYNLLLWLSCVVVKVWILSRYPPRVWRACIILSWSVGSELSEGQHLDIVTWDHFTTHLTIVLPHTSQLSVWQYLAVVIFSTVSLRLCILSPHISECIYHKLTTGYSDSEFLIIVIRFYILIIV